MRLAPRDRRALVVGALAAAAIVSCVGGVRPLQSGFQRLHARRSAAAERLARYEGLLAARGAYREALGTLETHLSAFGSRTLGADGSEAVHRLLALVERAATASRVRIARASTLAPDTLEEGVISVGAVLEAESDLAGLLTFLSALERSEKLLHVSEIRVRAVGPAGESDIVVLEFSFQVRGFVFVRRLGVADGVLSAH